MRRIISYVLACIIALLFINFDIKAESVNCDYKLSKSLKDELDSASDNTDFSVVVWLDGIDNEVRIEYYKDAFNEAKKKGQIKPDSLDGVRLSETCKDNSEIDNYLHIKRETEKELHFDYNNDIISKLKNKYHINTDSFTFNAYAPMIFGNISKQDIYRLILCQEVNSVYQFDNSIFIDEDDIEKNLVQDVNRTQGDYPYGVWQNISNINVLRDALGYTGYGVKIGMIENHVPSLDYTGFSTEDRQKLHSLFDYLVNSNRLIINSMGSFYDEYIPHANLVLSILTGYINNNYCGVAPNATIYCTDFNPYVNQTSGQYFDGFIYLLDQGVNVINASIAWGDNQSEYNYISKFLDYITSNDDVTICMSTGNTLTNNHEVHNGSMAYNIISVGCTDDNNTITLSDDTICTYSCYSNSYNSAYKPDISAPGDRAATYLSPNTNIFGGGGTSSAAPIVTGICALLMEADPSLKTSPTLMKSIIMSSAKHLPNMVNIYSGASSVNPSLLRNYGAGMIDAYQAYSALNGNRFYESESNNLQFTKSITVKQSDIINSKDIYICTTWEQMVTLISDSFLNENNYHVLYGFDHILYLYDPNNELVAKSSYAFDRKQFIRYKPTQAGVYSIKVNRVTDGTHVPAYYPHIAISYNVM